MPKISAVKTVLPFFVNLFKPLPTKTLFKTERNYFTNSTVGKTGTFKKNRRKQLAISRRRK